jgi:NitT/TauT family transport system substrate-binding protein
VSRRPATGASRLRGAALAAALACLASCRGRRADERPFRLGFFPNVTHAQALVGADDGTFSRALGGDLEMRTFHAGPAAMEALLAGDLDATYVGAGPAVIAFLRTEGQALRVVAGAVSGGAALVVRDAARPEDLAGKRVGSPQLGNTQDVALRTWLRANGLSDRGGPRGVEVTPLASPEILRMFSRGDLAGAWVAEPWGARLVAEGRGRILVDERTLWPDGKFPTTVLVVSTRALERRRAQVMALLRAHAELTRRWRDGPARFAGLANEGYARRTGKKLGDAVLADAFSRMEPASDPMRGALQRMARQAQALGFAPPGDLTGMVDDSSLAEVAERDPPLSPSEPGRTRRRPSRHAPRGAAPSGPAPEPWPAPRRPGPRPSP